MIDRYTRPAMGRLWSEEARLQRWLDVELALVDVLAERGEAPPEVALRLRERSRVDVARMKAIEAEVKHDVIAFVSSVAEKVGDDGRWLHLGLTSSDVVDTAFALQLRDAADVLLEGLDRPAHAVRDQALRHRQTPMIGRTHGIHAEVITFGLKCAGWYAELSRDRRRLAAARAEIAFGKLSGGRRHVRQQPPGGRGGGPEAPRARAGAPGHAGRPARPARGLLHVPRGAGAAPVERIATEIRHLQRTEVGEVAEPFGKGQKGSSAMPAQAEPDPGRERHRALAAAARLRTGGPRGHGALARAGHQPLVVERVIGPDATIVADFMLERMTGVVSGLEVRPEAMRQNLERLGPAIYSEQVLLGLVRRASRATTPIAGYSAARWRGGDFQARLAADADVAEKISRQDIEKLFDMSHHLRHIDSLFRRALEDEDGAA
jgi:adenylosuccinate lyase